MTDNYKELTRPLPCKVFVKEVTMTREPARTDNNCGSINETCNKVR